MRSKERDGKPSAPVDAVISWVDGSDPEWLRAKARAAAEISGEAVIGNGKDEIDAGKARYRDWGTLRFLLRGIERYAPWIRRIWLVTCGQRPEWLNEGEKLRLVSHELFMDGRNLPTFNSNAIEVNLHRIPGLAEQFVYFNDDMLLNAPVRSEDFFIGGLPRDMLALQPVVANPKNPVMSAILLNDSIVISRHFSKRDTMRKHPGSYFHPGYPPLYFLYNLLETAFPLYTGFYTVHGPSPLLRRTFEEVWALEPETLRATSGHRFRSREDVTQYLFREWQKQKGAFVPADVRRSCAYFEIGEDNRRLFSVLKKHRTPFVCVNDPGHDGFDTAAVRAEVLEALEQAFPGKSGYER